MELNLEQYNESFYISVDEVTENISISVSTGVGGSNSGDYNDLLNKPDLSVYALDSDLSTKANKSYVDSVNATQDGRLSTIEGALPSKANKTYVDSQDANLQAQLDAISIPDVSGYATSVYVDDEVSRLDGRIDNLDTSGSITQADLDQTEADANTYTDTQISGLNLPANVESVEGAQSKANAAETAANSYTDSAVSSKLDKTGGTVSGDIIPDIDNTHSLGSATKMWKDVYIGPGSLYINGTKIIEDVNDTINISADVDQNMSIKTSGLGNLELQSINGLIQFKGNVLFQGGKQIRTTDGSSFLFDDSITMSAGESIKVDTLTTRDGTPYITNGNIPTNVSELTNDAGYATVTYVDQEIANISSAQIELGTIEVTADRTFVSTDNLKTIVTNTATNITLTIPAALADEFLTNIINKGTGTVTIASSGPTLTSPTGLVIEAEGLGNIVKESGADTYIVYTSNGADELPSHTHVVADITDFPSIPSNTSDLTNDSGYITGLSWAEVTGKPTAFTPEAHTHVVADITDFPTIPSNTSDLANDSGYITNGDIPTNVSAFTNDSGYLTSLPVHSHDDLYYTEAEVDSLLSGKVDDAQVLTDVPAGAVFTDTTYTNLNQLATRDYSDLQNIPSTFTPDAHTHSIADVAEIAINTPLNGHILQYNTVSSKWENVSASAIGLQASDIDTLAELNGIVSDATLIDTNDSRLSDARTPLSHDHSWNDIISDKPTTLSGYGITDAYTKTYIDTELGNKVDDTQVLTDVPAGAVFTDTVYDDTAIQADVANKADTTYVDNQDATKLDKQTNIQGFWRGTQAAYDALTPDANTIYLIEE